MAKLSRFAVVLALISGAGAGCSRGTDLEKVPVGSDVQLTREDGGVVEGKLQARDQETVKVDTGPITRTVARKDIAEVRVHLFIETRRDCVGAHARVTSITSGRVARCARTARTPRACVRAAVREVVGQLCTGR